VESSKLDVLKQVAAGIVAQFGAQCEVLIGEVHTKETQQTLVHIENGHLSGYQEGDTLSLPPQDKLGECHIVWEPDGKIIRTTAQPIYSAKGKIAALVTINHDVTGLMMLQHDVNELLEVHEQEEKAQESTNITDVLEAENELRRAQLAEMGSAPEQTVPDYNPIAELNIFDWTAEGTTLTIHGFARVMSLAKGDGTIGQVESCTLMLRLNDVDWESRELQLLPGEASDSMELELEGEVFALEELADGDTLELRLEVLLTDGKLLTAVGGGWDYAEGQLMMIAG